ncbi:endonuclease [bacterium]|nr:endonuclease [bacterium]
MVTIIAILCILIVIQWYKNREYSFNLKESEAKFSKLLSQKKSSEVLTGHIAEKFVPFLKEFKHNPQQSNFLGQPIDYLVFGDDEITFVEIKSGNSRLSAKQRKIKQQILDNKVGWEEIRIK